MDLDSFDFMVRNEDGEINNCALPWGYSEVECQVCLGLCPGRHRIRPTS